MEIPSVCDVCGKAFLTAKPTQGGPRKYCSNDCRRKGCREKQLAYQRDWNRRQREKNAPIVAARKAERERKRAERKADEQARREAKAAEWERIKETCWKCGARRPDEFRSKKTKSGGTTIERICKRCRGKQTAAWKKRHPERVAANTKALHERVKNDHVRLMKQRIRQRIQKSIRRMGKGVTVEGGKMRYLGCSAEKAAAYLEQQFISHMSWENYGTAWHIDHVIPLAAFDLSTEQGRKAAFHYTNLQPLWAKANQRKNATVPTKAHQPRLLLTPAVGSWK